MAVQATPAEVGIPLANWNGKVVRPFVEARCGVRLGRSACSRPRSSSASAASDACAPDTVTSRRALPQPLEQREAGEGVFYDPVARWRGIH